MIPSLSHILLSLTAQMETGFHPIIVQEPRTQHAAVIGAWGRSEWIKSDSAAARVKSGIRYRLYGLSGKSGEAIGGAAGPVDDTGQPFLQLKPDPGAKTAVVGIAASWQAAPRRMKVLKTPGVAANRAVKEFLRGRKLTNPVLKFKEVLRGDLNGDGKLETLVVAEKYAQGNIVPDEAKVGDYSVVLIVSDSSRKALRLASEVYPPVKPAAEPSPPNVRRIIDVLDLNGDGKMEVVVQWQYYEGGGFDVYTFDGLRARRVLEWSAGL